MRSPTLRLSATTRDSSDDPRDATSSVLETWHPFVGACELLLCRRAHPVLSSFMYPSLRWLQSFPNADGMRAQLQSHLYSLNRQADLSENKTQDNERTAPIDLIVVTDSEAILGIGDQGVGGITVSTHCLSSGRGCTDLGGCRAQAPFSSSSELIALRCWIPPT